MRPKPRSLPPCPTCFRRWITSVAGILRVTLALLGFAGVLAGFVHAAEPGAEATVISMVPVVEVARDGATTWDRASLDHPLYTGDRIRTGEHSRATLRLRDESILQLDELTEQRLGAGEHGAIVELLRGVVSFFHRDRPGSLEVRRGGISVIVKGTEFVLAATPGNPLTLTLIDGSVSVPDPQGTEMVFAALPGDPVELTLAEGQPPRRTAVLAAGPITAIQWMLYYPAVLDLRDLELSAGAQAALAEPLRRYSAGDLLGALAIYPSGRTAEGPDEQIFHAALQLSVGNVKQAERLLEPPSAGDRLQRLTAALHQLIGAAQLRPGGGGASTNPPALATEWLALSYARQAGADLAGAREAARSSVRVSPQFGFGWARLEELEFSFGRIGAAEDALHHALELVPSHAQAHALQGFMLAARQQTSRARVSFNEALALDPRLGNAWLGRGLTRIHQGDVPGGRADLMTAAASEPQRALFRSYLGKAYAAADDPHRARHELALARQSDPKDPTPWLYSALESDAYNRVNDAIQELEHAQALGTNRAVYRSDLLLDEDRAVRSANLARIYLNAGLTDWSVREAIHGVLADYAGFSPHLFLANSYEQLRDPRRINLRYETAAESEFLVANLIAPVGAGILSPRISQQEYSKLFEQERLGVSSSTEYLSRGAWMEQGAQFGMWDGTSYSLEATYRSDPGERPNQDFEQRDLRLQWKQQFGTADSVYLQVVDYSASGGDVRQLYSPDQADPTLRFRETQEPSVLLGYHHEWSPGNHTLLALGRLSDHYSVSTDASAALFIVKGDGVTPDYVQPITANLDYRFVQEIWTAELQQVVQAAHHTLVGGLRYQQGTFDVANTLRDPAAGDVVGFFQPDPAAADDRFRTDFERVGIYGYDYWAVTGSLTLIGGLGYDWLKLPRNFRSPPVTPGTVERTQFSPKVGLAWRPWDDAMVRAAFARSLSGASLDQTFQLEPTQVAGFSQSFRDVIPESVVGANAGAPVRTYGVAFEQHFPSRTYAGLSAEIVESKVTRDLGVFEYTGDTDYAYPATTPESLDYRERALTLSLSQLLGDQFSVGAHYRLSGTELRHDLREIPRDLPPESLNGVPLTLDLEGVLHRLNFWTVWNDPSGVFVRGDATWYGQHNTGYAEGLPGADFWQLDLVGGYRFPRQRAEFSVGVLNLGNQDYHLNPLSLYYELPRERTFVARFKVSF